MSRDLAELLDASTPASIDDVDYDVLARRGRRRRRVKGVGVAIGTLGIVAAAVVVVDAGGQVPIPGVFEDAADVLSGGDDPESMDAGGGLAPVGSWELVGTLPGGARTEPFVGLLSDGRVVVFGGMDRGIEGRRSRVDGAIIDPTTKAGQQLPDAPVSGWLSHVALARDRLLVIAESGAAVLDTAASTWSAIPERPHAIAHPSVLAWTGTTLLAGSSRSGEQPDAVAPPPADAAPEPQPFVLYRWDLGGSGWEPTSEVPLRPGEVTAVEQAFDGARLALFSSGGGQGNRAAVYDLATDTWDVIPERLLPDAQWATLGWIDAGLAVVPVQERPTSVSYPRTDGSDAVADPVAIDLDTATSTPLPPIPDDIRNDHFGVITSDPAGATRATAGSGAIVVGTDNPHTSQLPTMAALLDDGTWTPTIEARTISVHGGTLVATTVAGAFPNLMPLEAAVLTEDGWAPAADSGLDNRSWAGVLLDDDGLLVVGGWSVRPPAHGEEPDARPSEPDDPGAYVIDLHDTIWRLRLPG